MSDETTSPAPAAMTDEEMVDAFWQAVADAENAEGSEGGKWAQAVNDGDRYRAMILAELARLRGQVARLENLFENAMQTLVLGDDEAKKEVARLRGAGWVSVKVRMPAQDGHKGHVLVSRDVGYDPRFGEFDVTMGYHTPAGWRNDRGPFAQDIEVTHWMPLPEPAALAAPAPDAPKL